MDEWMTTNTKLGKWPIKKKMLFGFTVIFILVQVILAMAATSLIDDFLLYSNTKQFERVIESIEVSQIDDSDNLIEDELRQQLGGFSFVEDLDDLRRVREIPLEIIDDIHVYLENNPDQLYVHVTEAEMIFAGNLDDHRRLINVQKVVIVSDLIRVLTIYIGLTTMLSFIILFLATYFYLGYFVKPIIKIKDATRRIANFDFEEPLMINTKDELEDLANSINTMSIELQKNMNKMVEKEIVFSLGETAYAHFSENGQHIERVSVMMYYFAKVIGEDENTCERLKSASTMHDIGKIAIPDDILKKPGKLSEDEFEVMKTHTVVGERILGRTSVPTMSLAREIALYHHERMDGKGYPAQLKGNEIPKSARMMAIVDVYDALINERVYKKAMSQEKAMKVLLQGKGQQFDAQLLKVFLDNITVITDR